jgi:ABC-type polysaccharide/polyol phosphate transport system ATPase subunit
MVWRNRRCYHKEYWALKNVDLVVEPGMTTAILGPNGAGKSTLLQIMVGVLQPSEGTVKIGGRLTAILELGAGFQPEYTGRENVLLNGMILGISKDEMLKKMDQIAEFAEIGDFFDQPVKTYSSGMVVRVAFAASINVDPEILVVDEALAVGDQRFQNKCIERIRALQKAGKTIVFVSHAIDTVKQFCQQAVLLDAGRVVAQGDVDKVVPLYEDLMECPTAAKHFTAPVAVG